MHQNLEINYAKITYIAPSNIAFIKYWGKRDRQIPMNPSLSMTLDNCFTKTTVELKKETSIRILKSFKFEEKENIEFRARIENYLNSIIDLLPWLKYYSLEIKTENSFPHSTGIASSASSFAALAACLEEFSAHLKQRNFNANSASELARLGSGSAGRSIQGPYMTWGLDAHIENSSNSYATKVTNVHENFQKMNDSILIVSSEEKSIGSTAGHMLMNTHLFNELRYIQAKDNISDLLKAILVGDFDTFGTILENEALTLHALMMSSNPSYILLEGRSLDIIKAVKSYRSRTNIPVYFTIDAGPNIHLIYPDKDKAQVLEFIQSTLLQFCEKERVIHDHLGFGAKKIEAYFE